MSSTFRTIRIGVFISAVNLLIQGVAFLVSNFMAKNLGNVSFAYFGILQSDYTIFTALADFGTATLLLAFFGKKVVQGKMLSSAFQLRYVLTFSSMLLMMLFACLVRFHHPAFRGEFIMAFGLLFQHAFFDWYFVCGKFWKKLLVAKILHTISYSGVMGFSLFYLKTESIEGIALSMVLAALPAWGFGATAALRPVIFKFTHRSFLFIRLMLAKAFPFALSSLASFLYLPLGLYAMDLYAPREIFGAYNYANKLIVLASGLMVNFISSSLVTKHEVHDDRFHIKDIAVFTAFIAVCCSPAWIFPEFCLKILFFAAPIRSNPELLSFAAFSFSTLVFSLIFQATRVSLVATMLKEKRLWTYVALIFLGGTLNAAVVFGLPKFGIGPHTIPVLALTGDAVLSVLLAVYFRKRFSLL
ncbi:MAG: oligosaccharide flippase family protein [Fibrobacter sp.]|nr:oligosaccharide flippase family protein [Fibrobacter sp.]